MRLTWTIWMRTVKTATAFRMRWWNRFRTRHLTIHLNLRTSRITIRRGRANRIFRSRENLRIRSAKSRLAARKRITTIWRLVSQPRCRLRFITLLLIRQEHLRPSTVRHVEKRVPVTMRSSCTLWRNTGRFQLIRIPDLLLSHLHPPRK